MACRTQKAAAVCKHEHSRSVVNNSWPPTVCRSVSRLARGQFTASHGVSWSAHRQFTASHGMPECVTVRPD
eukprot:11278638-Alexandrium_andersonii.AAC.1